MKFIMPKIDKNIIIGISIAVVLIFTGIISWTLFQKGKIPPKEEIIEEKEEIISEVLERLTPEDTKPLTEEEQEELDNLLKQLTPTEPKLATEQEQKETEELLKQLTP